MKRGKEMMSSERHSSEKERRVCEWGSFFVTLDSLVAVSWLLITRRKRVEKRREEDLSLFLSFLGVFFSEMSEGLRTQYKNCFLMIQEELGG